LSNTVNALSLPSANFNNYVVKGQYIKFQNKINEKLSSQISNLSADNKSLLDIKLNDIKNIFVELD